VAGRACMPTRIPTRRNPLSTIWARRVKGGWIEDRPAVGPLFSRRRDGCLVSFRLENWEEVCLTRTTESPGPAKVS
jgi:hypothetical protein